MFITFEGIDYSGKSTQAKFLVDYLERDGHKVVFLREPGGTAISEKIRELLLDKEHLELAQRAEVFLFSASRTQLVSQVIKPALENRKVVVCDRFYDSTTAYQGYGRGLDLLDVNTLNRIATFGTTPDLTFLVDVTVDEIIRRQQTAGISADRIESAGKEFFERVRAGYHAIAQTESKRYHIVNGMRPVEEIRSEVWTIVQQRLSHSGA